MFNYIKTNVVLVLCLIAMSFGSLQDQTGLLAYYTFDENTDANDMSGNNRHGEAVGVTFTNDRFGKPNGAYYFNGTNAYIKILNFIPTTNAVSYAIWVKPALTNRLMNIISKHTNNTNIAALLRVKPDNRYSFEWNIGGTYYDFSCYGCSVNPNTGITNANNNSFDFIVFTYDGKKAVLYKNSLQVYSTAVSGSIAANSFRLALGAKAGNFTLTNEYFKGVIDDVKVYGRALTMLEVMQMYQREKPIPTAGCRLQDSLQLVSIYQKANGANWYNKWSLAKPINTWYGVSLNALGCVSGLDLTNNGLSGTLPTNVSFSCLQTLKLASNELTGSIPNFNLSNLDYLNLNYNKLSGTIPELYLPNLTRLYLNNNQLSGCIPPIIKVNCPKIGSVNASVANNPLLAMQDWPTYWNNPTGVCNSTNTRIGLTADKEPFELWPNPADNKITLGINAPEAGDYDLVFSNILGQKVMQKPLSLDKGYKQIEVDISSYGRGTYVASLRFKSEVLSRKFLINR